MISVANLPGKPNFLANACIRLTADLGGNSMVRLEVMCEILRASQHVKVDSDGIDHTASFHLIGTPVQ
jgi:hypothetical protein